MYMAATRCGFVSLLAVVTLFGLSRGSAFAQTLTDTWVTDGRVRAAVTIGSTVYIGGAFSTVGPRTGGLVSFNEPTGQQLATQFPQFGGAVYAIVSDGGGGFYVGGDYLGVGGTDTGSLVHILHTGLLDINWNPNPSSLVRALALSGTTLYVGGEFSAIGGQVRNGLGAVSTVTGLALPWDPNIGPMDTGVGVTSLAVVGSTVFAGGPISNLRGGAATSHKRNGFIAVDATTGASQPWTPRVDANGFVHSMLVIGGNLYLGGEFSTICPASASEVCISATAGALARNAIAAINPTNGQVLSFNPNPADGPGQHDNIYAMALSGNALYVGGAFNATATPPTTPSFGGLNRNHLAAVDMNAGTVTGWDPGADAYVKSIAVSATTVYIAGGFRNLRGSPRNRFGAVDAAGSLMGWNPNANDEGSTLHLAGSTLHVGGRFSSLGGQSRNNLAAITLASGATLGQVTPFNPPSTYPAGTSGIHAMAVSGNTLYLAGAFTNIGGLARTHLAAIDTVSGNLITGFAPTFAGVSVAVTDMVVSGTTLYLAGSFTSVGGLVRAGLAAVGANGGPTEFNSTFGATPGSSSVSALAVGPGGLIYTGGTFTTIGNMPRNRIAALDATSGEAKVWNPNANASVTALAVSATGNTVYASGDFTAIGGQTRTRLAALNSTSGNATGLNVVPGLRADRLVVASNNILYAVGLFRQMGNYARHNVAAIDASSVPGAGVVTAWNPEVSTTRLVDDVVIVSATNPNLICVVGDFFVALRRQQRTFAAMTLSTPPAGPRILNQNSGDPNTVPIAQQSTPAGQSTPPLQFRVGDDDSLNSLTFAGSSSFKQLVPDANITFGGSDANRTVTVRPAAGQSGATDIKITVSDGLSSVSTQFALIVQGAAPTISNIANQTTTPGTPSGPHAFTVGDAETALGSLTVTGSSSNTTLLPNASITFGGSGGNRTVTVTPAAGQTGVTTITLTVTDGGAQTATTSFTLTVSSGPPNTPPTITNIGNQTTTPGTPSGPHAFTVGDAETALGSLTVTGSSSNLTLLPGANITFGGSAGSRTVTVTPAAGQTGTATVTVTVADGGGLTAQTTFNLSVAAPSNVPTITDIPDQQTPVGVAKGPLAFTVGDLQTPAGSLTVSATSSDTSLVPVGNIVFGGSGANRTVTLTPVAGQGGNTTITITVSDGAFTASDTFVLLVKTISLTGPFYMSEGRTGIFFDLYVALANPNTVNARVNLTFLPEFAAPVASFIDLPPMSRRTILVDDVPGLADTALSTVVESVDSLPVIAERTMYWDPANYYGGHGEKAGSGADRTWLFAEGSQGFFDTFLLLANPNPTETVATIRFLTESGAVVTDIKTVPPNARLTIHTMNYPALADTSFGMTVTFSQPAIAERAMYFGTARFWDGGHSSAGVNAPATRWFHAEGATGPYFDTFILVANPNNTEANVVFTYFLPTGQVITKNRQIAANSRLTVLVDSEDAALADTAVSTQVTSDVPVVSERSMYWAGPFTNWFEAHNSFGATILTTKWGFAEGAVGGARSFETYLLITNPNASAMTVTVTYLRQAGAPIVRTYLVNATSRFNVEVRAAVPELQNEEFATIVEGPLPFAVERAMYWNALGVVWAGGTNATATPLR